MVFLSKGIVTIFQIIVFQNFNECCIIVVIAMLGRILYAFLSNGRTLWQK